MHRQASFLPAFFPDDVEVGLDVDFFYFPSYADADLGDPVVGAGTLVTIGADSPAARGFIEFLKTPLAHEIWMAVEGGGFLTPHTGANTALYSDGTKAAQGEILLNATTFRFDASDLMPGAIGAGAFWTGMIDYVGGKDAESGGRRDPAHLGRAQVTGARPLRNAPVSQVRGEIASDAHHASEPARTWQMSTDGAPWWKRATGYQIYPRSFCDSNGDGIGDIPGIISRLDHLRDLGIGFIWLSPIYASPMVDNGYDISDYQAVASEFGTLEDMETLIAEARARGIGIVMDLVVNHTSSEHRWFQRACASNDPAARDFYIWRPPAADGGPPSDLKASFGGSAWHWVEEARAILSGLFSAPTSRT